MKKIRYATTNKKKVEDAQICLEPFGIRVVQADVNVPEIQADSLVEVARDKAVKPYNEIGEPLIAMDSGLFIEDLNGFPGIYAHYVDDTLGVEGLLSLVEGINKEDPKGYVEKVIVYIDENVTKHWSARVDGVLLKEERGGHGFFYDSIFYVPEVGKSLSELTTEEKSNVWGSGWVEFGEWF